MLYIKNDFITNCDRIFIIVLFWQFSKRWTQKKSEQKKNKYLNLAAAWIALGFLTKGFAIVAICGLVFLFYCFFNRKLNSFFSAILNIKAWTIFIIIVSPWLVYLYMQTSSEAVMYMLFGQSFGRFSNAFENHSGSIFYYLVVLPFITLPFSLI